MKKITLILLGIFFFACLMIGFVSCRIVRVDAGEVAVLVDQPWFIGKGGVRNYVWGPGLQYTWASTNYILYKTIPITYEEHFENIVTKDNNPISFSVYIKMAVRSDSAWYLHGKFLEEWYKLNISPRFRTKVRDKACSYEMFQLTSQREISVRIEKELQNEMTQYVNSIKMPVYVAEINVGSVQPQPKVLDEIANTAAKVQNQKTQIAEGKAQDERKIAEEKRALADMAYKNKMGLTNDQFVQLEYIKMYKEVAGKDATFIVGNIPGITIHK